MHKRPEQLKSDRPLRVGAAICVTGLVVVLGVFLGCGADVTATASAVATRMDEALGADSPSIAAQPAAVAEDGNPVPDFAMSLSGTDSLISPGSSSNFRLTLVSISEFFGVVHLSALNAPQGWIVKVAPSPMPAGRSARVTVGVPGTAPAGHYEVQIAGKTHDRSHTATLNIDVAGVASRRPGNAFGRSSAG